MVSATNAKIIYYPTNKPEVPTATVNATSSSGDAAPTFTTATAAFTLPSWEVTVVVGVAMAVMVAAMVAAVWIKKRFGK